VKATVFNGSAIYVPTAFTPNHDGLNDILKPFYVGIKTLYYFTIYNRWGEKVFSTTDMNQGWDGSWKQTVENGSAYVWVLKAVDMLGKMYNLKGSFILLK
jgi:gliding motility-associated-like protein